MTETMKKFKPEFRAWMGVTHWIVVDGQLSPICSTGDALRPTSKPQAVLVAKALNFYYANKREQSERKGEKE